MALKDAFSESDWNELARAPMITSFAVTAADPSGLLGIIKESTASAKALAEAKNETGTLASEVVATYETAEGRESARECIVGMTRNRKPVEATAIAVDRLQEIGRIADANAPEHAAAFKEWLMKIAHSVAEAANEGGFLGFGGEKVSDAETRTIEEIERALHASDSSPGA